MSHHQHCLSWPNRLLKLVLLVAFFITIGAAGTALRTLPWLPLWVLALVGIASSLVAARGHMRVRPAGGSAVIARSRTDTLVMSLLVLLGVLALRGAVIFSAQ